MRKRTQRRKDERDEKKIAEAKWKLALMEDGFRADRPIVVESASQIEPHVRGMTCPACVSPKSGDTNMEVGLQIVEHVATAHDRVVRARCARCGRTPSIHFVLRASTLS